MVDTMDSKSIAARRAGSSPASGTNTVIKLYRPIADMPTVIS